MEGNTPGADQEQAHPLQAIVDAQTAQLNAQNVQLENQAVRLNTQSEQLEKLSEMVNGLLATTNIKTEAEALPKIPSKPVKVKSKEYKWNVPAFFLPGDTTKYTAEAASTDKDVIAKILSIEGQGLLTEIV